MNVHGNYQTDGYAHLEGLIPVEVAQAFLRQIKADLPNATRQFLIRAPITRQTTIGVYASHYPAILQFLWGLTPVVRELTGADILPSYDYFRLYRKNDICRVHSDRDACEHSLSLTLGYSDEQVWPFEIGSRSISEAGPIEDDFGEDPFRSIVMKPGDAVLYRGVQHRHGRISPNPNRWSAHLFLHWVDRDGPHAAHAFDAAARGTPPMEKVDFDL